MNVHEEWNAIIDGTRQVLKTRFPDSMVLKNSDVLAGIPEPKNTSGVSAGPVSEAVPQSTDLQVYREKIQTCAACGLAGTRTRFVFGEGSPRADVMFIGEAPGAEEDRRGIPFAGEAGQLLTKILASVGFSREEVFIGNILKCRPPQNRDPRPEEVEACKGYLKEQIRLIRPRIICTLGRYAAWTILRTNQSMKQLRGTVHQLGKIRVVATYHPSALLQNSQLKRPTWEDMKMLRGIYDGKA